MYDGANEQNQQILKTKEDRKKNHFGKKLLASILFGLLFGIFAAAGFLGIKVVYHISPAEELLIEYGLLPDSEPKEMKMEVHFPEPENANGYQEADGDLNASGEELTVPEVVQKTMPSIVSVNLTARVNYYGYSQEVSSAGSGIIVGQNDKQLLIVTNYHVIEAGKDITVQFCDGTEGAATVKGQNIPMDLAVLTVELSSLSDETKSNIKVIKLGDSNALEVGEEVIAIGNSLGYGQSVTTGVVSALNREMTVETGEVGTFIQTDAAINQGNSGGALLNHKGELIGINSNKLGGTYVEGMGYAIPINAAEPIISQLMNKEELVALPESEQSYLGISGMTLTSSMASQQMVRPPLGVYVADIIHGGAAENAGIQRGDIITEFEGNSLATMEELQAYLAASPAGSSVMLKYERLEEGVYVEYECEVILQNKAS